MENLCIAVNKTLEKVQKIIGYEEKFTWYAFARRNLDYGSYSAASWYKFYNAPSQRMLTPCLCGLVGTFSSDLPIPGMARLRPCRPT